MAHPVRREWVEQTLDTLDRDVEVIWDMSGPPSPEIAKRWANGRRAWMAYDPTADWHMVLQDDVLVCKDLLAGLEAAVEHLTEPCIVQPFFGTRRPIPGLVQRLFMQAEAQEVSWIRMRALNWGLAIMVPTGTIEEMLAWCDDKHVWTYDQRIGKYYMRVPVVDTFYTHPSLVDHRVGPSLVGHGDGRHAHRFFPGSALDLSWTARCVTDPRVLRAGKLRSAPRVNQRYGY